MKTSSKGKSEMLGRMQWRKVSLGIMQKHLANKSEMLGRMQWKHLAKVSQKC